MILATTKARTVLAITAMAATSHIASGLTDTTASPSVSDDHGASSAQGERPEGACGRGGGGRPPPPEEIVGYFIQTFDQDKDGGLSITELTAALKAGPPPPPGRKGAPPAGDQQPVDRQENQRQTQRKAGKKEPAHADVATALVELFDADKNGNLDQQELTVAMVALMPPPPEREKQGPPPADERPS